MNILAAKKRTLEGKISGEDKKLRRAEDGEVRRAEDKRMRRAEDEKSRSLEGERVRGLEMRPGGEEQKIKNKRIRHFRDLMVYQRAFAAAMRIYEITKSFPPEEKYSLVDQIRRSSRSVCSNLAEAWRKRKYSAMFRNKITDSMMESSETQCWLEFAFSCGYLNRSVFSDMDKEYEEIIAMLNSIELNAKKFCF